MTPTRAGIVVASAGMVLFFVYHWLFVAPVVAVFVEGIAWALGGGAILGWAYRRSMLDHGRTGTRWGLAFGALFASTLLPSELVGLVWGPFPEITRPGQILPVLPLAFLGVPLAIVIAWRLGRGRITWPFVAAVAVLHFMIGGSIANFGGRGTTLVLFCGFLIAEVAGGWALAWLARPSSPEGSPPASPTP